MDVWSCRGCRDHQPRGTHAETGILNDHFRVARHSGANSLLAKGKLPTLDFEERGIRKRGHNLSCPSAQGLACSFESIEERLLGELLDDRFDDPSQPKWHVSRQRYGSALDDYTGITLLESPKGIQAP
jgi:hypothetical protein